MKKEKIIIIATLVFSITIFYAFGFYHLAKFETVDEHFWKFERIPQYWKAIKEHNLKKTYINDKPGVTVALLSGAGLFFEPHPENLRIREKEITKNDLFTVYNEEKTEDINFALRCPLLIFNGLFFLFFFWIIKRMTNSNWIAIFYVAFMAVSPVLVGISQILNPDSLLWVFSAASIFSYFALIKTMEKKFIFLTALFTGLSLLSKYSANILFLFFLLIMFSEYFIYFEKYKEKTKQYFSRNLLNLIVIFIGSAITFSVFMPAVFVKIKYLYRGTIGAPGFSMAVIPIALAILLVAIDTLMLKSYLIKKIGFWLFKNQQKIFKSASAIILIIFLLVIINTIFGQKIIPFDKLREDIYRNGKEIFDGILQKDWLPLKISKEILLQFYPFVFSQLPLLIIIVMSFWFKTVFRGLEKFRNYLFFCTIVPVIYFSALIFSNVSANIRYSIMMYPLLAFLGSMSANEFIEKIKTRKIFSKIPLGTNKIKVGFLVLVVISGIFSLWKIKPFYFNYSNFLLPSKFIITDSWGYGEYEAAEYLNSLPDSEKILIWTDRSGICQFIKGNCIRDYKIDLTKTRPDYFVLSRRGSIRHQFVWRYPELANKKSSYYYDKEPIWSLYIKSKEQKFVKIVESEE